MADDKIEILRALHGNDGYVFYFGMLEQIYKYTGAEYNISDAETIKLLSRKLMISPETFDAILRTALKYGCFDADYYGKTGCLTSTGIKKRASVVVKKRESMREKYGGKVSEAETGEETIPETPQRKENIKEKKSELSDIVAEKPPTPIGSFCRFKPPTPKEVADYCSERHNGIDPQRFVDYYSANGWTQGKGKPVKDWKACVRLWERQTRPRENKQADRADYSDPTRYKDETW
jgi:hypothetical protein